MVDIDEIMARLSPKTRERVQAASEIVIEKLPTPSTGLTLALVGGFGYGRQSLVWGNKSSGKSSFCLQMIATAQKEGKVCAFIDAEQSFDPEWAKKLGVDIESLIVSQVKTTMDMVDVVTALMREGVDVIVVDSISSLLPTSWFKDDELKELDGTKQIGSDARDMANAVRMMNYANTNTALILISQIRNKIMSFGALQAPTGGEAVKFFSSTSIKLTSTPSQKDQLTHDVAVGDRLVKKPVARTVNWLIEFNKLGQPSLVGEYNFYYAGNHLGIDSEAETIDLAVEYGVIEKGAKSSWYIIDGAKVQGKPAAADMLRADRELNEKIIKELNEQIY